MLAFAILMIRLKKMMIQLFYIISQNSLIISCGECGAATNKGYVEILEFTHFAEFFSFNRIAENHKGKELVRKVSVVVALDLGC